MISDYAFFRGIDNSVNLLSKFGDQPTYYYLYRHRSDLSLPKFLGTPSNLELGKKKNYHNLDHNRNFPTPIPIRP